MDYGTNDWPALPPLSALVNRVHETDALTLLAALPTGCVDLILTDPPYAVTEAKWDVDMDWAALWPQFKRVLTPRGACVMTTVMRFAWKLIALDPDWFKYDMVGIKSTASDFLNAKNKPMRMHENIMVFSHGTTANKSDNLMNYYPQMQPGIAWRKKQRAKDYSKNTIGLMGRTAFQVDKIIEGGAERYPTTVLPQQTMNFEGNLHPNQKPVALFEYLVASYTQTGMLVLDPFGGSGTTAEAARNLGRNYITCDISAEYCELMRNRLSKPFTPQLFTELATA